MFKLPWMSRRDRRLWESAGTLREVGELMARWLEGDLRSRPGYAARFGPDDETVHLIPSLAAACRAGLITTISQPGLDELDRRGRRWQQRAAFTALVADFKAVDRLSKAAIDEGLVLGIADDVTGVYSEPYIVTTVDGDAFTAFGGEARLVDRAVEWQGLAPAVARQAIEGYTVTVAAPEWGPEGERLWAVLDRVTGRSRQEPRSGVSRL